MFEHLNPPVSAYSLGDTRSDLSLPHCPLVLEYCAKSDMSLALNNHIIIFHRRTL